VDLVEVLQQGEDTEYISSHHWNAKYAMLTSFSRNSSVIDYHMIAF